MKVKVTTEFKDRHTGELHRSGDILDLNIQRINEILSVGGFIELVEQSEPEKEQEETAEPSPEGQEESETAGEQEETPKQTTRRKRR